MVASPTNTSHFSSAVAPELWCIIDDHSGPSTVAWVAEGV